MPGPTSVIGVDLVGHLSRAALEVALASARAQLASIPPDARCDLLVDALRMTDYDQDARTLFVSFNAETRERLRRVAILTDNRLYLMVIAAMSLAARQTMRAFSSRDAALAWFAE